MLCAGEAAKGSPVSDLAIERATPDDAPSMLALLAASGLPTAGLTEHLGSAYVARRGGRIVGTAALELYEGGALLRSVAVDEGERGGGLGRLLTERAVDEADARELAAVYLLTTSAEEYFTRFGFAVVAREQVPDSLRASVEFQSACPASATVMRKALR
jgi:amino-acid N-acetyltransferase